MTTGRAVCPIKAQQKLFNVVRWSTWWNKRLCLTVLGCGGNFLVSLSQLPDYVQSQRLNKNDVNTLVSRWSSRMENSCQLFSIRIENSKTFFLTELDIIKMLRGTIKVWFTLLCAYLLYVLLMRHAYISWYFGSFGSLVLHMWTRATLLLQKHSGSYEDQPDWFQRDGIDKPESFHHGPVPSKSSNTFSMESGLHTACHNVVKQKSTYNLIRWGKIKTLIQNVLGAKTQ